MNTLFTLTLTEKAKAELKKNGSLAQTLLEIQPFDKINVLAVRNWRTRVLKPRAGVDWQPGCPRPAAVHIHDEEWLCQTPDAGQGHIFSLSDDDLERLQEAIVNDFYTVN